MTEVAFEQRPEGMVMEGAMQVSGKRTSQSQGTGAQGKELPGVLHHKAVSFFTCLFQVLQEPKVLLFFPPQHICMA